MKQLLKLAGSLLAGMAGGYALAVAGIVLLTDRTLAECLGSVTPASAAGAVGGAVYGVVSLFAAGFVQVILHEGGHLVCGLLSGYRFVSFRVWRLTLIRRRGRLCLRRYDVAGTGGQCLMAPPEGRADEIPVQLYNWGGVIANALSATVALVLLLVLPGGGFLVALPAVIFIAVGYVLALLNGIPMSRGGVCNDTANCLLLKRDPLSRQALVAQLRANALVQDGLRPVEMPSELFRLTAPDGQEAAPDYASPLQAAVGFMQVALCLDRLEWEEAYRLLADIGRHRELLPGLFRQELDCERVFAALATGRRGEAVCLYTPALRGYAVRFAPVMSAKQRLLFAVALLMEGDAKAARRICDELHASAPGYLMQGEVRSDLAQMEALLMRDE